jgi:hypothetical protein
VKRLSYREGADKMGATEESRKMVLDWKDWWENEMEKKGAVVIDVSGSVEDVAKALEREILRRYHGKKKYTAT